MVELIKKKFFLIVLLILSIILPLIWLPNGYSYLSEEDNFANYQNVVYRNASAWSSAVNGGNPAHPSDHTVIMPNGIFYYALSTAHIPNHIIQKIYIGLILFLIFIAVSYFLRLYTQNDLLIFIGVLFYYFNFYIKSTLFYSAKMYQLILMPLFFVFTYKYLKTRNKKYAIYNFLALFFFSAIFSNLATLVATFFIYPVAIGYYFFEAKRNIQRFIKDDLVHLLFFFLLLAPIFIYQLLVYYFSFIGGSNFGIVKSAQTFSALSSPIDLVLQLRGSWWEFVSFGRISYNSWLWFYNNPFIVFCSLFLFLILLLPLLKVRRKTAYFFWLIVFLISVILASGASFYPYLYRLLYVRIPFFYIFREPWAKFMPILILSFTTLLVLSLKRLSNKYLIWACLFFIVLRGFPFFSTDFFERKTERWFIPFTKTPPQWEQYEKWSLQNRDKNILLIPINYFKRNWYREDIGNANHPYARLFGYTNVYYDLKNTDLGSVIRYFISQNNPNFIKITAIDAALFQRDIDTTSKDYTDDAKNYDMMLKKYFTNKPKRTFNNKLFIHTIKPMQSPPLIFSPKNLLITKNIHDLNKIVSHPDYDYSTGIYLLEQNGDKLLTSKIIGKADHFETTSSITSFQKINPAKYKVTLENARDTTALIFNQNYHQEWKLLSTASDNFIDESNHFVANGYANSWIIDVNKLCNNEITCQKNPDGTYRINFTIEYMPQYIFTAVQIGAALITVSVLLYVFFTNIRKRIHA